MLWAACQSLKWFWIFIAWAFVECVKPQKKKKDFMTNKCHFWRLLWASVGHLSHVISRSLPMFYNPPMSSRGSYDPTVSHSSRMELRTSYLLCWTRMCLCHCSVAEGGAWTSGMLLPGQSCLMRSHKKEARVQCNRSIIKLMHWCWTRVALRETPVQANRRIWRMICV